MKMLAIAAVFALCAFAQDAAPAGKPRPVAAEPKDRPNMEQMVDKMFADADTNKDGVLSKEEFAASMKKRMEGRMGQGGMGGGMGRGQGMGPQGQRPEGRGMGNGRRGGPKAPPMAE